MKDRILLVGDYNRTDFLYPARALHTEVDFFFIEHSTQRFVKNSECAKYGKVLFWKDFKSAYELLNKIRPNKVIFYFIESYSHVALNVACKSTGVPTYHLEHGVRFSLEYYNRINEQLKKDGVPRRLPRKRIREIPARLRTRRFFTNTKSESPALERAFLDQYFSVRSAHSIIETFQQLKSPLRLPDTYIAFSPAGFGFHKELECLPGNYPVKYIGIPVFDRFFRWSNLDASGSSILFIDQPFSEYGHSGWTREKKLTFLGKLTGVVRSLGKKLYIKPHPLSDATLYTGCTRDGQVELVGDEEWDTIVPDVDTVLGFTSTLLLPFVAMQQICCFTMDMHAEQGVEPHPEFLEGSNAVHTVFSFEELRKRLENRKVWHARQKCEKERFVRQWMYRFDGKSSDRLREVVVA